MPDSETNPPPPEEAIAAIEGRQGTLTGRLRCYARQMPTYMDEDLTVAAALLDANADEIAVLQAIVDKLPKTKDGEIIHYGMPVWFWTQEGGGEWSTTHHSVGYWDVYPVDSIRLGLEFDEYRGTYTIAGGDTEAGNGDVYAINPDTEQRAADA